MGSIGDLGGSLTEGFHGKPPGWSTAWMAMWLITTPLWIWANLNYDEWWIRLGSIAVLFGIPEAFSLIKRDDAYPPLTHTIRHFLPNWLAFPLIYGVVSSIGTRWLGFDFEWAWKIGAVGAVLGWMTDHFTLTYQGEDPFPYSGDDDTPSRRPRPA